MEKQIERFISKLSADKLIELRSMIANEKNRGLLLSKLNECLSSYDLAVLNSININIEDDSRVEDIMSWLEVDHSNHMALPGLYKTSFSSFQDNIEGSRFTIKTYDGKEIKMNTSDHTLLFLKRYYAFPCNIIDEQDNYNVYKMVDSYIRKLVCNNPDKEADGRLFYMDYKAKEELVREKLPLIVELLRSELNSTFASQCAIDAYEPDNYLKLMSKKISSNPFKKGAMGNVLARCAASYSSLTNLEKNNFDEIKQLVYVPINRSNR